MASVSQLNLYQCDQCGTANIVAAPSCINRERAPTPALSVPGRANPTLLKQSRHPAREVISARLFFGDPHS
jgi:hypothetical protein